MVLHRRHVQICNDDGTWLRLSMESVKECCYNQFSEAWCMQYNQHLGRTLLFPISNPEAGSSEEVAEAAKVKKKRET